jgi:hypothetical protein
LGRGTAWLVIMHGVPRPAAVHGISYAAGGRAGRIKVPCAHGTCLCTALLRLEHLERVQFVAESPRPPGCFYTKKLSEAGAR